MTKLRESIKKLKRAPIWLPYLQSIEQINKDRYKFIYNGGEVETELSAVTSIMLYGDYGRIETEIFEDICNRGIPIIIHKRNIAKPVYICTPLKKDIKDTLTYQILVRNNQKKSLHIAKQIIKNKLIGCQWLRKSNLKKIKEITTIKDLRSFEAVEAKNYWNEYFKKLNSQNYHRRDKNYISSSLDAQSKYISGILLRWITYHNMSPFHGFLHTQSDYPSLVYDLIEPYRAYFEKIAFEALANIENPATNQSSIGLVINATKEFLNKDIYTGLTRQIVTVHELLHGIVLSLKNYLLKDQKTFMIPMIDSPNGGRPKKISFRLYGRQAGKTDFWKVAKSLN